MIFSCKYCNFKSLSFEKDCNGIIKFPEDLIVVKLYSNNYFVCVCFDCANTLLLNNEAYIPKNNPEISLKNRYIHPKTERFKRNEKEKRF